MPGEEIGSTMNTAALIALLIAGGLYILAVFSAVKRIVSKRKKTSSIGVVLVILATVFAISAMLLYVGFSLWIIIGIIVADSILMLFLTDGG